MKRFIDPPSQEDEEWHPENGELNAHIDRTSFCQFRRNRGLAQKVLQKGSKEEDLRMRVSGINSARERESEYRRDRSIGSVADKGQKYEAEPSRSCFNQRNLMSMPLDALIPDDSFLPHVFKALHEELGSGGHEGDGNDNGTEADPRVGLGFCLYKFAFRFLQSFWGGGVERESIVLARGVVQEDSRADIAEVTISV